MNFLGSEVHNTLNIKESCPSKTTNLIITVVPNPDSNLDSGGYTLDGRVICVYIYIY